MFRRNRSEKTTRWWWDFRYIWMFLSTIWVFNMVFAIVDTWQWSYRARYNPRYPGELIEEFFQPRWAQWLATILAIAFILIYVEMMYRMYFGRSSWIVDATSKERWFIRGPLLAIAIALTQLPSEEEFRRWPYTFVFVVIAWTLTSSPQNAFSSVVISTALTSAILTLTYDGDVATVNAVPAFAAGFMMSGYVINRGIINELYLERSRVRDQAVTEERFRLARDLHDTVGHSMTQITLKAELARKTVLTNPARAIDEIEAIETLSRSLSAQVRRSIAGETTLGFRDELARAADLLATMTIALETDIAEVAVSSDRDEALAWIVREAVLNVVKHSGATSCSVTLRQDIDTLTLIVRDNGSSTPPSSPGGMGHAGIRQRVEPLGGSMIWQPTAGAHTLEVRIPLA